jgi:hypothetical protein
MQSKKAQSVNRETAFQLMPSVGSTKHKFVARVTKESRGVLEAWENNEY